MDSLKIAKEWLDENPAARDWWHDNVPEHIKDSLRTDYLYDPGAMRDVIAESYPGWELKEIKDKPDDAYGWYAALHTPYGQVGVFSNSEVFKEMGESVQMFTKLNKHWWGRLWLRFVFWLNNVRNKKT